MKYGATAVLLFALAYPFASFADSSHHPKSAQTELSDGEVRKIDKETKKITIRHGPLKNLDMPAMTMVFQVKDPAMLEQVKTGDKIRFLAEKAGGAYVVTTIQPAR
jgi:Cu(I)/Ag(I) efflux system periplasmic protein CusF